MDVRLKYGIRFGLGVLGIIALFKILPYFTFQLEMLVELFKLTDTSPEFKIILVCLSMWVTMSVMNMIVNIIFKLHKLLEDKLDNKNNILETRK